MYERSVFKAWWQSHSTTDVCRVIPAVIEDVDDGECGWLPVSDLAHHLAERHRRPQHAAVNTHVLRHAVFHQQPAALQHPRVATVLNTRTRTPARGSPPATSCPATLAGNCSPACAATPSLRQPVARYMSYSFWRFVTPSAILQRSIVMSVSVCVCVSLCLSVCDHIFGTTRPIFTKFLCMLLMAVARSSSGGVVMITLRFRVSWMTPYLHIS